MADMGVHVTSEVVIARPRREVAAFAADPERWPLWHAGVRELAWHSGPPLRGGSRLDIVSELLRRRVTFAGEVAEHATGERLVLRGIDGSAGAETSYLWRDAGDGSTRMTLEQRGVPAGLPWWLLPLAGLAMRRAAVRDLALLKAILEARGRREAQARAVAGSRGGEV